MISSDKKPLLSVEDLRVIFRGDQSVSRAVDGVSFDIYPGETVCLVGESGCGKTVSALSILGLIEQPPGEIAGGKVLFEGRNLLDLGEDAMQEIRGNRIAMVFQEPLTSLNPVFTIGDQLQEAIRVHKKVAPDALREQAISLLKDIGMPSPEARLKDYPHQLSGGQRQRVMIAMALSCNPDLIIADEPTTALDVTVQAQILRLMKRLQDEWSMSILYITHDLRVVESVADRVYVMYAGLIAEEGTTGQVFREPHHPYTQGLLASLPTRGKRGKRLHSIPGSVPNPAYKPAGCPFHPRCKHALESCRTMFPGLCDYGEGHWSRCPVLFQMDRERKVRP